MVERTKLGKGILVTLNSVPAVLGGENRFARQLSVSCPFWTSAGLLSLIVISRRASYLSVGDRYLADCFEGILKLVSSRHLGALKLGEERNDPRRSDRATHTRILAHNFDRNQRAVPRVSRRLSHTLQEEKALGSGVSQPTAVRGG